MSMSRLQTDAPHELSDRFQDLSSKCNVDCFLPRHKKLLHAPRSVFGDSTTDTNAFDSTFGTTSRWVHGAEKKRDSPMLSVFERGIRPETEAEGYPPNLRQVVIPVQHNEHGQVISDKLGLAREHLLQRSYHLPH